ncbi:DMT family transporter [Pseudomonas cichorii]|uniref:DMT family transporter n=1 Tax=Pseudomonas cichorii TaxID=36746 RepID=UPI001C89DDD3|nr:DMT family transporter [Pseudomonas cichorii]MBX8495692.1 DMT family transporter [Pseudomonas cichorii]
MSTSLFKRPEFFALIAAILNGTIGVFTRMGFAHGATSNQIAFWKCFAAFLVIALYCATSQARRRETLALTSKWPQFAVLAFLGIFCLYFFETWAFEEASIPLVAFLLYAAGAMTIVLSAIFLGERIGLYKVIAFAAILTGVYLILSYEGEISGSYLGITLALLGGLGYALFIFTSKLMNVGSGLPQLAWLFGFGSLYLLVPLLREGFAIPDGIALLAIAALVLLPTIGGFYFTTKAVDQGEASKVQIIETSDPLFATLFAFSFFGESLGLAGTIGALCIMAGLILAMKKNAPPAVIAAQ